jgi:hypothetical protein
MDQFRSFDQLRTNELSVIRHGFFKLWYEFTDGQFCYGKLNYGSIWKPTYILEIANKTWIVKRRKGMFSRAFLIDDADGNNIGTITFEILSGKILLNMNNGFEATYLRKKIFTRTLSLTSTQYGDLLDIKLQVWHFKTPFKVSVDLDKLKNVPDLPLLALLGINLILIEQVKAAKSA